MTLTQGSDYELISQDHESSTVRLLVVEDNPVDQRLYRRYLESDEETRYHISIAPDAERAAQILMDTPVDCILLDHQLPRMNGLDFLSVLKSSPNTIGTPVIMLTGQGNEDIAVETMHRGASDYIPKQKASTAAFRRAIANAIERAKLKRMVESQTRSLKEANEQLRARSEEIQRFYDTVSHEIKTPLTAIREFTALILDGIVGEINEQEREILSHALDSCDELASQFNDLVECARLGTGKMTLRRCREDIRGVVARSAIGATPALKAKGLVLEQEIADGLPEVDVDSGRMVQVIANLLGNAIKYSEPGGKVKLFARTCASSDSFVELGVQDSGCGIQEDHLPRIFDRHYQAKPRGDELMGAGLGLGLTIAKEIVSLHGGEISAESEPGAGSTFTIRIPAATAENSSSEEAEVA